MLSNFYVVPDVLTKEECEQIILNRHETIKHSVVDGDENTRSLSLNVRNSKSSFIEYGTCLDPILRKIQIAFREVAFDFYRFPICHLEPFSYVEYEKDMFYKWHFDSGSFPNTIDRDLSASLILSDPKDYEGGRLEIKMAGTEIDMQNGISIKRNLVKAVPIDEQQGMMVVFPSTLLHHVPKIKKGKRCSLVVWGKR